MGALSAIHMAAAGVADGWAVTDSSSDYGMENQTVVPLRRRVRGRPPGRRRTLAPALRQVVTSVVQTTGNPLAQLRGAIDEAPRFAGLEVVSAVLDKAACIPGRTSHA